MVKRKELRVIEHHLASRAWWASCDVNYYPCAVQTNTFNTESVAVQATGGNMKVQDSL